MANYSLVRGWIECLFEDVETIKKIVFLHKYEAEKYLVNSDIADLYWEGWSFPSQPINWVSFVFYGGNVNSLALPFIKDCLIKISKSGVDISGVFYINSDEEEKQQKWELAQNCFID